MSVSVIKSRKNKGLASSIIDGVTKIINIYDQVIVLEDDIVTSPLFLKYMNNALKFYRDIDRVWHISGWNYPITSYGKQEVFLWRTMNCWGWGTWANRWNNYEKNATKLIKSFSKNDIYRFNIDGYQDFFQQIVANQDGKINTWAIFWYAIIFKNNGLCLNPIYSYVQNIGNDGSGTNCGSVDNFFSSLNHKLVDVRIKKIEEDVDIVYKIKDFLYKINHKPFYKKILNKIMQLKNI